MLPCLARPASRQRPSREDRDTTALQHEHACRPRPGAVQPTQRSPTAAVSKGGMTLLNIGLHSLNPCPDQDQASSARVGRSPRTVWRHRETRSGWGRVRDPWAGRWAPPFPCACACNTGARSQRCRGAASQPPIVARTSAPKPANTLSVGKCSSGFPTSRCTPANLAAANHTSSEQQLPLFPNSMLTCTTAGSGKPGAQGVCRPCTVRSDPNPAGVGAAPPYAPGTEGRGRQDNQPSQYRCTPNHHYMDARRRFVACCRQA